MFTAALSSKLTPRDAAAFLEILKIGPCSNVDPRRIRGISVLLESLRAFRRTRPARQELAVPRLDVGRRMRPCGLPEPGFDTFVGRMRFHRGGELFTGNPGKIYQPHIHRTGVNVFAFRTRQDGPALIDHSRQMDVARQRRAHASWKVFPEVHGGFHSN